MIFVREHNLLLKEICFHNIMFLFENIMFSKKVNCLLRKYDFLFENISFQKELHYFLRNYDLIIKTMLFAVRKDIRIQDPAVGDK